MPNIDFSGTSAYRDSTRGATIKALQLRQQKLQEETAAAQQPRQIASPWQGAAQIADVIGSSIREGRAANEEQAGRQRFAQLLAGGLTPDEMGEAIGLDPETAMRYQEHTWDTEKTAAETATREKEALRSHGWDVDAATSRVQAEKDAAAARVQAEQNAAELEAQAKVAADKAARTGAIEDRDFAAQAQKDAAAARAGVEAEAAKTAVTAGRETSRLTEQEKLKTEQVTAVPPEIAKQRGGIIERDPSKFEYHPATGDVVPIGTTGVGVTAPKEIYDAQDKLASTDSHLDDINRALELNDNVIQGPAGKVATDVVGSDPTGMVQGMLPEEWTKRVNDTKEYSQLVSTSAMTRMAEELKGSTAYQEIMHYQELFASPTATAEVRRNALIGMRNALMKHREVSGARLREYGADEPGPYKYTPRTQAAPTPDASAAPAAPAAPAAEESVDDIIKRRTGGR